MIEEPAPVNNYTAKRVFRAEV